MLDRPDFICACCEWAIFKPQPPEAGLTCAHFGCDCPQVLLIDGRTCAHIRPRPEWPEARSNLIYHAPIRRSDA